MALAVSTSVAMWTVWPQPWAVAIVAGTPVGVLALIAHAVLAHERRAVRHAMLGRSSTSLVTRNITGRQAAERALRESEEQHRHLLELLPDAIAVAEDGGLTYANRAFRTLCGLTGDTVVRVSDVFPRGSADIVATRIAAALEGHTDSLPVEAPLRHADGSTTPARLVALQVVQRERRQVLLVLQDLTPERRGEAMAASVVGHAIDAIISIDADGTITTFNPAAENIFGYGVEEVVGKPFTTLLPAHLHPVGVALLAEEGWVEARTRSGFRRESEGQRRDGTVFPIDIAVSAFSISGQTHIVGVVRDLSEQRRLELELQQSRKLEALGQIAGGVAHDFNNLLTVVSGYADLLSRELPAGKARDHAAGVARAAERATALTRQLLTFSRRAVSAPAIVNVNAVLEDAGKMLTRVIGEHITLSYAAAHGTPSVVIDPGALEQVVMNLVINARDAMPSGGTVQVATGLVVRDAGVDAAGRPFVAGPYVSIAVSDTGTGIPDGVRARIFEPFFTTKDAGKGTGLGLAVVQSVVEQAGGHVLLDSDQSGTTFRVELPAVAPGVPATVHTAIDVSGSLTGERVLVVEDEGALRQLLVITLSSHGYVVSDAADGAAALEWIDANGPVDVVVTDVVMPRLGGRALADALSQRHPHMPVIFTSGYTDDAMLREHVRVAEIDFIAKPYTPAKLLAKVRDVLDRPRKGASPA